MQNITDNPKKVRALGNISKEVNISDFKKSNSEITMSTEIIPDLGETNVFEMSYSEGSLALIVTEAGDFTVGGVASLDIIVVNNNGEPVDLAVVELTINDTTDTKITDDDGTCNFPLDTSVADTFEFTLVATYENKVANLNDKYTIKEAEN